MSSKAQAGLAAALPGLSAQALASLQASLEPFAVAAGAALFRQNDPPDGMHVITEGRVCVRGRTLADGLVDLAEVAPGELVGEFALVDQGRRSASAEAVEPTRGFFMPREQFERLVFVGDAATLALSREIRRLACRRTRATVEAMAREPADADELRRLPALAPAMRPRAAEGIGEMLAALHQFRHLKPAEAIRLASTGEVLDAPRGAVLARSGAPADGVWIVLRGAVRSGLERDGAIEQLLLHGPGKIVGGVAAMDGQPQAVRFDAREDAILLHLGAAVVAEWTEGADPLAMRLVDLVTRQLVADLRALSRLQGRIRSMAVLNGSRGGADV